MRVLVTGAAGSIGRVVTAGLGAQGYDVVALDRLPLADRPPAGRAVVGDVLDTETLDRAVAGVDAVVHLASRPDEASLPEVLESHVHTMAAVLDAMVRHGVPRLVYASSNHAVGLTPREEPVDARTRPRPDSFYGVGKVAAEALGSLYADRHGVDVVACRIGSFLPRPTTRRHLSTWLSHHDAVRMVVAGLTAPRPGFAVLYGISANTRGWWDLRPGRALGYEPRDDAESYADEILATEETGDDLFEASYVGGPFAAGSFARRPFH
jgi:uronate dehydrogenase